MTDRPRIVSLLAENIKRIKVVRIKPDGSVVRISGPNDSGKTSVLDAIWWAITGGKNVQERPIRDGEQEARIELDLGSLKVTRRFKHKKDGGEVVSSLIVETAEGARYPSPQAVLDGLVATLAFDPLQFATRMTPREQYEALRGLVTDVDFDAIAKERAEIFAERTDTNRRIAENVARASAFPAVTQAETEEVDVKDIMAELDRISDHNKEREEETRRRDAFIERMRVDDERVANIEKEIKRLQDERDIIRKRSDADLQTFGDLPAISAAIDPAPIKQKLLDADKINERVRAGKKLAAIIADLNALRQRAAIQTTAIGDLDAKVSKAITSAKLPVSGLTLGDGSVLLNDRPFEQASTAQKLRVSMAIAAGLNPKLRVMIVREGAFLDKNGMELLTKFADENDFQIWVERVGDEPVGFVLEDGSLKVPG